MNLHCRATRQQTASSTVTSSYTPDTPTISTRTSAVRFGEAPPHPHSRAELPRRVSFCLHSQAIRGMSLQTDHPRTSSHASVSIPLHSLPPYVFLPAGTVFPFAKSHLRLFLTSVHCKTPARGRPTTRPESPSPNLRHVARPGKTAHLCMSMAHRLAPPIAEEADRRMYSMVLTTTTPSTWPSIWFACP